MRPLSAFVILSANPPQHLYQLFYRFGRALPSFLYPETVRLKAGMPHLYINKLLNELREELLSAMHAAVEREVRPGKPVDVSRLYRAFTRAATGKMANPVEISDRCFAAPPTHNKKNADPSNE